MALQRNRIKPNVIFVRECSLEEDQNMLCIKQDGKEET